MDIAEVVESWLSQQHITVSRDGGDASAELAKFVEELRGGLSPKKTEKETLPDCERCTALTAASKRCTRRRAKRKNVCGTHAKGTPHGMASGADGSRQTELTVTTRDFNGIPHFVDDSGLVYSPRSVLSGGTAKVVGAWRTGAAAPTIAARAS